MKLLRNIRTVLANPSFAREYVGYCGSKLLYAGRATRVLPGGVKVSSLSGFSEFHSCVDFVSDRERSFLAHFPFEAGAIVDVGANLGVVSLLLAKRFRERMIHSFEPNPSTYSALSANLKLNSTDNIKAQPCALADRDGEIFFAADPVRRGTASISSDGEQGVRVPCQTLDTYAEHEGIGDIAFLKVDVEGFETSVFRGAERLLNDQRVSILYYEVCPAMTRRAGFNAAEPTKILQSKGYSIYELDAFGRLKPVRLEMISQANTENWIGVSARALGSLPESWLL